MGDNDTTQEQDDTNTKDVQESVFKEEDHQQNIMICKTDKAMAMKPKRQHTRSVSNNVPLYDVTGMSKEEIGAKIQSMYQKIDGVWTCNECGKTSNKMSSDMRLHVETHLDGLCYTCNICNKDFRSKALFKTHKRTDHTTNF